jgi:uncharacterized damage-inducible protein DinB
MNLRDIMIPEFEREAAAARVELERVPERDAAWKPHPKSYSMGDLAVHLASIPGWVAPTLAGTEMDFNPPGGTPIPEPPAFSTLPELLARFDAAVAAARAALAGTSDEDLGVSWSLKNGGAVLFTQPRHAVLRSFVISHLIHHRAQLGVYLRLRDVPLPPVYGPTADTEA